MLYWSLHFWEILLGFCIGFFGLYFFMLVVVWFCLGIFGGSFLVEALLNSTSYKYSQVSNSDVPVASSIDKVYAPFFGVLITVLCHGNTTPEISSKSPK